MKPKERVYAALRREPADRIPIFMWFHPGTRVLLSELFEVPPAYVDVVLGNDVRMTWVNNNYCMEGIVHQRDRQGHVDPWGIRWVKEGPYNQIAHFPLAKATAEEQPTWGNADTRGVYWELATAATLLQAGSDIMVMRHPDAVHALKGVVGNLMK